MRKSLLLLCFVCPLAVQAQTLQTENVFLVTLDGLRWQELFAGADSLLIGDERYVESPEALRRQFWDGDAALRPKKLMPFFQEVIAEQGQIYGNRLAGSNVSTTNQQWFSYPGYNEILSGSSDDQRIDSNDKVPNPNATVLAFVNRQPGFEGKVAAFGSWDVFPYILDEQGTGVPVNAGFEPAAGDALTEREVLLNELQRQVPSPWESVRLDAFTHHYALEYLKKARPRLLYVAYGETDDFAHEGKYDAYLRSAHRTDAFLRDLWQWAQSDPQYRNRTTMIVTTDHGRGEREDWTSHGADTPGSGAVWIAVLGPDTKPLNPSEAAGQFYQDQIAKTTAAFLGLAYEGSRESGAVLEKALGR